VGFYECFDSNRDIFVKVLTQNNFCAGYRNGTTLCNGDSGGGLYVKYKNRWFLTGIVSFSLLRENGQPFCSKTNYGILVNVPKFSPWLRNNLLPNSGLGPSRNINYDQVTVSSRTETAAKKVTKAERKSVQSELTKNTRRVFAIFGKFEYFYDQFQNAKNMSDLASRRQL
jgi:secreted trypsin-like serine protease